MKNKWKRIVIPVLIIGIAVMGALTAWSILKPERNSRVSDIPKDGIVSASVFKDLKKSKDMMLFDGESEEIKYQWLFLGSDVKSPRDTNLLVEFIDENLEKVKKVVNSDWIQGIEFKDKEKIDSNPTLSVDVGVKWNCSGANIYKYDKVTGSCTVVAGASVDNGDSTTITFTVAENDGTYYIVGNGIVDGTALNSKEDEVNANKDEEESKEPQQYLTGSSGNKSKDKYKDTADERAQMAQGSDNKDKYMTDPTPPGKPGPVEWQDTTVDKSKVKYCTLSVRCDTLLIPENYAEATSNGKADMIPADGTIYSARTVEFYEGEFVFDVLLREMQKEKIHMEFSMTPVYNSNYIEGIHNLYEFDGGALSGWMYKVNGWFPNYGCSRYQLKDGDVIEWVYTCDLGRDVGCDWMTE
ncbi:MAG: DUF4430 domain-containing protein [Clostridium sp.]|nr:DUF4430 domain-containing protein [Clostridium sp.]MDU7082305.1 DUF4430 domain-containing protein [Clostridium sp.]